MVGHFTYCSQDHYGTIKVRVHEELLHVELNLGRKEPNFLHHELVRFT